MRIWLCHVQTCMSAISCLWQPFAHGWRLCRRPASWQPSCPCLWQLSCPCMHVYMTLAAALPMRTYMYIPPGGYILPMHTCVSIPLAATLCPCNYMPCIFIAHDQCIHDLAVRLSCPCRYVYTSGSYSAHAAIHALQLDCPPSIIHTQTRTHVPMTWQPILPMRIDMPRQLSAHVILSSMTSCTCSFVYA